MMFLLLACTTPTVDSKTGPTIWPSDDGAYTVEFTTDPDPLLSGPAHFDVSAEGATSLTFAALMSAMGHGLSEDPVIGGADGAFTVDCVFPMSGTWTLQFTLDGGAGADSASGDVDVQ